MGRIATNRILIMAAAGACAGFVTFLVLDPSLREFEAASHNGSLADLQDNLGRVLSHTIMMGGMLGAAIGGALICVEEIPTGRVGRIAGRTLLGILAGALCGAIGGITGQILFSMLLAPLALMGQIVMPVLILARTAGWCLIGAAAGLCPGLVFGSQKRFRQGLLGGALGGAAGGLLFDVISSATQEGSVSRCIGLTLIGLAVGALVGLIEEAGKQFWLTMLTGSREGRSYILAKPVTSLGRSEMADVPLFGDTTVQRAHASILLNGSQASLRADAAFPVLVNGQSAAAANLADGDVLTLGRHHIRFHSRHATAPLPVSPVDAGSSPLTPIPQMPTAEVFIISGPHMGAMFPIFDGAIIGRDPRCDIALVNDTLASRQHARFARDGEFWRIEDGGSTNGTYVNGQRIISPMLLQSKDQIAIGNSVLQVA